MLQADKGVLKPSRANYIVSGQPPQGILQYHENGDVSLFQRLSIVNNHVDGEKGKRLHFHLHFHNITLTLQHVDEGLKGNPLARYRMAVYI